MTVAGLTDAELADKYIDLAATTRTHYLCSEMDGDKTLANEYREYAIFLYRYANELDPSRSEPIIEIGELSGDDKLRREAVDIAVGDDASDVEALLARAHVHSLNDDFDACMADLNRAVELDCSVRTLDERGTALYFADRSEEALIDFERAAELEPSNAEIYCRQSECWMQLYHDSSVNQHWENALAAIEKAIELDPERTMYVRDRSNLLALKSENLDEAIAGLDQLCKQDPEDWLTYKNRGQLHSQRRDGSDAAVKDLTKMIEILEKQPMPSGDMQSIHCDSIAEGYRLRAEVYEEVGDRLAADRDWQRAKELEEVVA